MKDVKQEIKIRYSEPEIELIREKAKKLKKKLSEFQIETSKVAKITIEAKYE